MSKSLRGRPFGLIWTDLNFVICFIVFNLFYVYFILFLRCPQQRQCLPKSHWWSAVTTKKAPQLRANSCLCLEVQHANLSFDNRVPVKSYNWKKSYVLGAVKIWSYALWVIFKPSSFFFSHIFTTAFNFFDKVKCFDKWKKQKNAIMIWN